MAPILISLQIMAVAGDAAARISSYAGKTVGNPVATPSGCQTLVRGAGVLHNQTPAGDLYYLFRCQAANKQTFLRLWRVRILDSKDYPALVVSEGIVPRSSHARGNLAIRSCDLENHATQFAVVIGSYQEVPDEITAKEAIAAWRVEGEALHSIPVHRLGNCPI